MLVIFVEVSEPYKNIVWQGFNPLIPHSHPNLRTHCVFRGLSS